MRISIPTRVFLVCALLVVSLVSVGAVSFWQHQRTSRALQVLHQSYLPLVVRLGEARATHAVLQTLIDRISEEKSSVATRSWLRAALAARPRSAEFVLAELERISGYPGVASGPGLAAMKRNVRELQTFYLELAPLYERLFKAISAGDLQTAAAPLASIRQMERRVGSRLRATWEDLELRYLELSERTARTEQRFAIIFAALTLLGLLGGAALTWWSHRLLRPLTDLQSRVESVARGELERRTVARPNTELGRLALAFEQMVDALAQRDTRLKDVTQRLVRSERLAAIGRMAAHISHEIRNPLSSIRLNVDMLADESAHLSPEGRALCRAVDAEIERLSLITEKYLKMARVPEPDAAASDLGALVQEVVEFMRAELAAGGITTHIRIESGLPPVHIDPTQVRQALLNLIRNAREAMPRGGAISMEVRRDGEGAAVSVEDQGTGIDAGAEEKIFELFYTTKAEGSGLGLPLVQQVMLGHNGRVDAASVPGAGARFTLWFPLPAGSSGPRERHDSSDDAPGRERRGGDEEKRHVA